MKRFILLGLLLSTFAHAGNFTTIQGSSLFSTLLEPFSTVATAASTTVLTFGSNTNQIFTGSTTQNVKLPAGTALKNGRRFNVTNLSTGLVTVKDNGLNVLTTVPSNATLSFLLSDNSTANGVWNYDVAFNINSLNGVSQTLAVGTSGTDFAVSSSGSTHTFNLPDAGASARGAVTTGTQTIAGAKTLSSLATLGAGLQFTEISTPSNPSAGSLKVYAKTDDKVYKLNSSGTETEIGAGGGGGIFSGGQNLITNNSFETDTTNWTASAGTFQRETGAGNIVPPGVGSASWDPAAANDTLTANNVTVTANDGLSGRNGVVSCAVKTAATDLKLQVYDGTNVISPDASTDVIPSSSAGFVRYSANFVFPSSGTIKARFKAQSNSVIAYIDDCYLGLAEGFNAFDAIGIATSWQSCTITSTWVSGATHTCMYRRIGDSAEYRFKIAATGAVTATNLSINLPSGHVIDTTKLVHTAGGETNIARSCGIRDSGTATYSCEADYGSTTSLQILVTDDTGSGYNGQTAFVSNTIPMTWASGDVFEMEISLPIVGWSGENAYRPDVSSRYWSGYHDGDCDGWTTASTSYTDFSNDASCTFTELQNKNFGTVSTLGAKQPGITFTPSRSGTIWACATTPAYNNTVAKTSAYQLTDGTNVYAKGATYTITSGTASTMVPLCGIVPVVGGVSTTIKIQAKSDSGGTAYVGANSGVHSVDWSLIDISQSVPAPLLVGSVTSNSTGAERIERATIIYSAGVPAVNRQSGSWISSITDTATGRAGVNIAAGIFSAAPSCTVTSAGSTTNGSCITESSPTSTSVPVACYVANTAALTDNDFNIICMGPR